MAFIVYTLVYQGLYTGVVNAISAVTVGVCSVISSLYRHKNIDVAKHLKKLDLERKLKLIETVLETKYPKSLDANTTLEDTSKARAIELCLSYIIETINEIHKVSHQIDQRVARHQSKWFNSWRTLNIKPQLEQLETCSRLLDERFDDLVRISHMFRD